MSDSKFSHPHSSFSITDTDTDTYMYIHDQNPRTTKKKHKNNPRNYITIISCISITLIINLIMIITFLYILLKSQLQLQLQLQHEYKHMYKYVFYDGLGIENIKYEGIYVTKVDVKGWSFVDDDGLGYGYIEPLYKENSDDLYEYKIDGECKCCMECFDDENCQDDGDVCRYGKCIKEGSLVCKNDEDCENGVCNFEGNCVEGCRDEKDCEGSEICNRDSRCVEGCKDNEKCNDGEFCIDNQCNANGCKDNFDCNDDNVCDYGECHYIDDNTQSCVGDDDCTDDSYCNYEYLVCLKRGKDTLSNEKRRDLEILPAMCSMYGVITMLVVATSSIIATNMARGLLNRECEEKCSSLYYTADSGVIDESKININELDQVDDKPPRLCFGNCKPSKAIIDFKKKTSKDVDFDFLKDECRNYVYETVIREKHLAVAGEKLENPNYERDTFLFVIFIYLTIIINIFSYFLNTMCKFVKHEFDGKLMETCVADEDTIQCIDAECGFDYVKTRLKDDAYSDIIVTDETICYVK